MEFGLSRNKRVPLCLACLSKDLVLNSMSAGLVCRNCGEVQQTRLIVESSESRNFEDDVEVKEERASGAADSVWDRSEFRGNDSSMTQRLNKVSNNGKTRIEYIIEKSLKSAADISFALHLPSGIMVSL